MPLDHDKVKVMKFGGTSMDDMEQIEQINEQESADAHTVLVVSAFSGVTDKLLEIAKNKMFAPHNGFRDSFEPIILDTLDRIRLMTAHSDMQPDFSHIEKFLRDYIERVTQGIWKLTDDSMFAEGNETQMLQDVRIDRVVSIGEIFSAHALKTVLTARSKTRKVYEDIDTSEVISRDKPFGEAEKRWVIYPVANHERKPLIEVISREIARHSAKKIHEGKTPVVPGYVGWVPGSILNSIDRGYTDSTAALTARGLNELEGFRGNVRFQIWKEVPGLFSADPRLVEPDYDGKKFRKAGDFKAAKLRRSVEFKEAAELSAGAGMKAINPHGITALDKTGIPLEVRNTFEPLDKGTVVLPEIVDDLEENKVGVRFVSGKKGQTIYSFSSNEMVDQPGVAEEVFRHARELGIAVDVITSSATTICFSVESKNQARHRLFHRLKKMGDVEVDDNMAIVSCIGRKMRQTVGILADLTAVLKKEEINIGLLDGDFDKNVTFVIAEKDYEKAIKALHKALFLPNENK